MKEENFNVLKMERMCRPATKTRTTEVEDFIDDETTAYGIMKKFVQLYSE